MRNLVDRVIHWRNKNLTCILRVDDSPVLNSAGTEKQVFIDEVILSGEIRKLMNQIRSLAINPGNDRLDYFAISKSEPYKEFQILTS